MFCGVALISCFNNVKRDIVRSLSFLVVNCATMSLMRLIYMDNDD